MQLNIYTVSHPIIQFLANSIINPAQNQYIYENNHKYTGFLFIYEILRKYVKTDKLYIKNMKSTKDFYLINSKIKCYIFTDLSSTYTMVTDIKILLPNIKIIHTEYENIEQIKNKIQKLQIENYSANIFILDKILQGDKIIKLIKYIKTQTEISLENINIACMVCYDETLNKLAKIYPKLKIYTIKIIYNNK